MNEFPIFRNHPTEIKVAYAFRCAECSAEVTQTYLGGYFMHPDAPPGWREFAFGWICDKHTVKIVVDNYGRTWTP